MKKIYLPLILLFCISTYAQDYKFGKVSEDEVKEEFYPLDSTADAAYLYKYRRSYFNFIQDKGFQLITEVHHRIKIYSKEGFDYATKSISYYYPEVGENESISNIKGYTYNIENGKLEKEKLSKSSVFKEKTNKYTTKVKITMPNIKVGSVIEYKYEIISPYATSIGDVEFQKGIPIKKLDSQLEFPEYYTFNKMSKGFYNVPMKTSSKPNSIGDLRFTTNVFTFEDENIPALKNDEAFVANIDNYRGGMKFELSNTNFIAIGGSFKNYTTSWENISKEIYKSSAFGSELDKSSYYKDDLNALLQNAKTDSDKLISIFQFVKSKVKWNGFYGKYTDKGVRSAYKENVGNVAEINLILTSMLREAGLNANPVLVSSRGNGIPLYPTFNGFDYLISIVQFPDNSYVLLDATEPYSLPNVLPVRALNWDGRLVTKDGNSSWIKLSSTNYATEENMIMAKITDDLTIEGLARTKFENLNALNFRRNYNHIKEDELIEKYEEDNKVEVENFKISNKEELGQPVARIVQFLSEDLIETINNKVYIEPLLFLTQRKNPFKLDERKFPVDFGTAWKDVNRVSIDIPEGYTVESLPETMAIALPENVGIFKYQVQQAGNKIKVFCSLEFNSPIIPAQYYVYLKDFYGKLVKKESEKIVLVKA